MTGRSMVSFNSQKGLGAAGQEVLFILTSSGRKVIANPTDAIGETCCDDL